MAINYTHKDNIEQYVEDNIEEINNRITDFTKNNAPEAIYDDTDIKNYLSDKLYRKFPEIKDNLLRDFEEYDFVKARIPDLANKYVFYKKDVERILTITYFSKLSKFHSNDMVMALCKEILDSSNFRDKQKTFLMNDLKKIANKSLLLMLQNGFITNINNVDSGIMTANAGDSAQFLFLSRAILAGFNCSNVDVRSSRYDAVIDYCGKIFKVQVKGISNDTVSFVDRTRGGRGIDTSNARNQGQRITSEDCDIYVAVDKQVGLCYIIPMKEIDEWPDEEIKTVNVSRLEQYRENWDIVSELYNE